MLTIVIPVYNAEQYIKSCLDSLLEYMDDIEIIAVDDGSTDESGKLLDQYQDEFGIVVIHQANAGVSNARNAGIKRATGKYITFVDADDLWMECLPFDLKDADVDLIVFNYVDIDEHGKLIQSIPVTDSVQSKTDIIKEFILTHYFNTCWGKLYRTELIKNNDIYFPTDMKVGEDMYWFGQMLQYIDTVEFSNAYLYGYRQNTAGAMVQLRKSLNQERIMDFVTEIKCKERLAHEESWNEEELGAFYYRFANNIVAKVNFAMKGCNDFKELSYMVDDFIDNETVNEVLHKAVKSRCVDGKRRIICRIMLNHVLRKIYLLAKSK